MPWYGPSLRPFPKSRIWALVIPTEFSVGVVGRDGLDEVVTLYGWVLVPGAALDWSTRGEPTGDLGSLDPSTYLMYHHAASSSVAPAFAL
jgi:hypothetical protein